MNTYIKQIPLYVIVSIIVFGSCAPRVSTRISKKYDLPHYKENVIVLGLQDSIPKQSEELGEVIIGDNGFTINCTWEAVVERAKYEARKVGGNAIKITRHNPPSTFGSSCHRITAKILKINNIDFYSTKLHSPVNTDYAVLHIYRHNGSGALISYNLYLGDTIICRVNNEFKKTINIGKEGLCTLWAKTEGVENLSINLEHGKEYYIRCSIVPGIFVGLPKLELVKNNTGRAEFQSVRLEKEEEQPEYNIESVDDIYYTPKK